MPNASTGQPSGCPVFVFLSLTNREVEALTLAAHGQTIRAIAGRMAIAERTVKAHLYACRRKLQALNTTHAVAIAATRRLIKVDNPHPQPLSQDGRGEFALSEVKDGLFGKITGVA